MKHPLDVVTEQHLQHVRCLMSDVSSSCCRKVGSACWGSTWGPSGFSGGELMVVSQWFPGISLEFMEHWSRLAADFGRNKSGGSDGNFPQDWGLTKSWTFHFSKPNHSYIPNRRFEEKVYWASEFVIMMFESMILGMKTALSMGKIKTHDHKHILNH